MFETDLSDDVVSLHVNPLHEHERKKGDMSFADAEAETDVRARFCLIPAVHCSR